MHQRTIAEAVENYRMLSAQLLKDNLDEDSAAGEEARRAVGKEIERTKTREFKTLGVVLGSRYGNCRSLLMTAARRPPSIMRISNLRLSRLPRAARVAARWLVALRSFRPRLHAACARRGERPPTPWWQPPSAPACR